MLDYIKHRGLKMAEAAAALDEAESTIRKIAYGQRQPSLPLAVKIANWSGGAISEAELLLDDAAGVASCGVCDRRADDPECASCIRSDCGLRQREAA